MTLDKLHLNHEDTRRLITRAFVEAWPLDEADHDRLLAGDRRAYAALLAATSVPEEIDDLLHRIRVGQQRSTVQLS